VQCCWAGMFVDLGCLIISCAIVSVAVPSLIVPSLVQLIMKRNFYYTIPLDLGWSVDTGCP
jgi:hypothetical protein